jgi:hypothetical protein
VWICTLSTLQVWDFVDGGTGDSNQYGDALNDGTGLTAKGKLHRAQAQKQCNRLRHHTP